LKLSWALNCKIRENRENKARERPLPLINYIMSDEAKLHGQPSPPCQRAGVQAVGSNMIERTRIKIAFLRIPKMRKTPVRSKYLQTREEKND
jgi:hypothetical protein